MLILAEGRLSTLTSHTHFPKADRQFMNPNAIVRAVRYSSIASKEARCAVTESRHLRAPATIVGW
jgi:hypothetical protein